MNNNDDKNNKLSNLQRPNVKSIFDTKHKQYDEHHEKIKKENEKHREIERQRRNLKTQPQSNNNFLKHNKQLQNEIKKAQLSQQKGNQGSIFSQPVKPDINKIADVKKYSNVQATDFQNTKDPRLRNAIMQNQKQNNRRIVNNKKKKNILRSGSSNIMKRYDNVRSSKRVQKLMSSNLLNVYTNRLVHWISGGWGKQDLPERQLAKNTFFNSSNKIYTSNSVKMPIILYSFPDYLDVGWLEELRTLAEQVRNRYNNEGGNNLQVSINHVWSADNSNFSFGNSKRLIRDYDNLTRQYEENANLMNDDSIKKRDKQKAIGEDIFRKLQTYEWTKNIAENNYDSLWETREFLEIVVSNGNYVDTAEILHEIYDEITSRLNLYEIKYKDLYATIQDYYDGFSPAGHGEEKHNFLFKKYQPVLRSGEQIVAPTNLRQGSISDPAGVPVGIDIYAEKPMYIDYSDNSISPSTLVSAATGSGKTFFIQSLLLGFLLFPDLYFPIVIDYKNEYVELAKSSGMQVISSSPAEGLYFSTIELPEVTGNDVIDANNLESTRRTTENVFEILLGDAWKETSIRTGYEYILQSLYLSHGVYLDDKSTWKNSKGLNFHTFYAQIDRILRNERGQAVEAVYGDASVLNKIQELLKPFFDKNGSKNNFFKKALRMEDINNSRGIVFALDRSQEHGGRTADMRLELSMQYIMHTISILTNKKAEDKRLITLFYEESNRLLMLPKVAELMSGFASTGRSNGIRNFFITNAPGQLFQLANTDRQVNKESSASRVDPGLISAIVDNIGNVIVGPNDLNMQALIAERFNLRTDNQMDLLELLAKQATGGNNDDSVMAHKFLITHRGRSTLLEAISNPILTQLDTFGTEVKVKTQIDKYGSKKELMNDLMNGKKAHTNSIFDTKQRINKHMDSISSNNSQSSLFNSNNINPNINNNSSNNNINNNN